MQIARVEKANGDPGHIASAVVWTGGHLKRCFPERFEAVLSHE